MEKGDTWFCPACGCENDIERTVCKACGQIPDQEEEFCHAEWIPASPVRTEAVHSGGRPTIEIDTDKVIMAPIIELPTGLILSLSVECHRCGKVVKFIDAFTYDNLIFCDECAVFYGD